LQDVKEKSQTDLNTFKEINAVSQSLDLLKVDFGRDETKILKVLWNSKVDKLIKEIEMNGD
jgi:hypothetical protein